MPVNLPTPNKRGVLQEDNKELQPTYKKEQHNSKQILSHLYFY